MQGRVIPCDFIGVVKSQQPVYLKGISLVHLTSDALVDIVILLPYKLLTTINLLQGKL